MPLKRTRHGSGNSLQSLSLTTQVRHTGDQPAGVWVEGSLEDRPDISFFHHPAGVHHHHAMRDLRHHPQVMGDKKEWRFPFPPEAAA